MKLNGFSPLPEDDELHLPELVYWASIGDLEQVQICLDNGVDVNSTDDEGYSALQAAAENNYLDIVKLLVSKGADTAYQSQFTALALAEMAKNDEIVAYLKTV